MIRFTALCSFCILLIRIRLASGCIQNPYFKDVGPIVKTSTGSVIGKYVQVLDTYVAAFLGVPFGKPPIGEKRFSKPEPVDPWTGIRQATKKPPPCMQYSTRRNYDWVPKTATPNEDCLYLNIWTPTKFSCDTKEKLPVLVWIHGGGFYSGSTDMDVYDGSIISSYGDVIVVSINYRLGVFGFLNAGNKDADGNAGLYDQALALEWIKNNVQYFGGNKESITLFGESAGAISISLLMVSPVTRGLFHRVILQSGSAYNPQAIDYNASVSFTKAKAFAQLVGCAIGRMELPKDADVLIQCLKQKPAWNLAKAEDTFTAKFPLFFAPSAASDFFPKHPIKAFQTGDFAPVDVLFGGLSNETTILLNYMMPAIFEIDKDPILTRIHAEQIMAVVLKNLPKSIVQKIIDFYFQNVADTDSMGILDALEKSLSDFLFNCPTVFLAEKAKSVYRYWMTHLSLRNFNANWMGVYHFYDVPFTFGRPIIDTKTFTPEDLRFSKDIIREWTTFARKGYPLDDVNREVWPKFSSWNPVAYELNPRKTNVLLTPRKEACEFWRPYLMSNYTV